MHTIYLRKLPLHLRNLEGVIVDKDNAVEPDPKVYTK
jgi:hypothetical protein